MVGDAYFVRQNSNENYNWSKNKYGLFNILKTLTLYLITHGTPNDCELLTTLLAILARDCVIFLSVSVAGSPGSAIKPVPKEGTTKSSGWYCIAVVEQMVLVVRFSDKLPLGNNTCFHCEVSALFCYGFTCQAF